MRANTFRAPESTPSFAGIFPTSIVRVETWSASLESQHTFLAAPGGTVSPHPCFRTIRGETRSEAKRRAPRSLRTRKHATYVRGARVGAGEAPAIPRCTRSGGRPRAPPASCGTSTDRRLCLLEHAPPRDARDFQGVFLRCGTTLQSSEKRPGYAGEGKVG